MGRETEVSLKNMMTKNIFIKTIKKSIFFILLVNVYANEFHSDVNNDGNIDKISYEILSMNDNTKLKDPTIKFKIQTSTKKYIFNSYYASYPIIDSCGAGCIKIDEIKSNFTSFFEYDKNRDNWFLTKTVENNKTIKEDKTLSINYLIIPIKYFVIKIEKQYLYSNPNNGSKTKIYLLKNDKIEILKEENNWLYILYKGKKEIKAWIPKSSIEEQKVKPITKTEEIKEEKSFFTKLLEFFNLTKLNQTKNIMQS